MDFSDVQRIETQIEILLKELGWTKEDCLNEKEESQIVKCSFNPLHLVPIALKDSHEKKCKSSPNYRKTLPQQKKGSSQFFYKDDSEVIRLNPWLEEIPSGYRQEVENYYFSQSSNFTSNTIPTPTPRLNMGMELVDMKQTSVPNFSFEKMQQYIVMWRQIPYAFLQIDVRLVPKEQIFGWIYFNIFNYTQNAAVFKTDQDFEYLYQLIEQRDPNKIIQSLIRKMGPSKFEYLFVFLNTKQDF